MAQWFYMVALTGRYTDSPESRMEQDLAMLRDLSKPEEFLSILRQQIDAVFTRDFWEVTLPNQLVTASANSPYQSAFFAALCILDAPVLYSNMKVRDLLNPTIHGTKRALERHHLFPRKYLKRLGIKEQRYINQVANYDLVEWKDNIDISDQPPAQYVPAYERRFSPQQLSQMYRLHALPDGWYHMDYHQFLEERRKRMAAIIREGYEHLTSI